MRVLKCRMKEKSHLIQKTARTSRIFVAVLLAMLGNGWTATEKDAISERNSSDNNRSGTEQALVGKSVDIAPWAYAWRTDHAVQQKPEACFIPRRLDRIDKVYRSAYTALPTDQLKSIYYQQLDLLQPLLPKPKEPLLAGLLWTGSLADYQVDLVWPDDQAIPSPEAIEVRVYPTSFGWFGWTVDKILAKPEVSSDEVTWTYRGEPGEKMDTCYNGRVDAATEMVAVFAAEGKVPIPSIRVFSPAVGTWKRMELEIEWGFQAGQEKAKFDGRVEAHVGRIGSVSSLPGDAGTITKGAHDWQSRRAASGTRRGIVVPLLYASGGRPGLDTRVTVWTGDTGFTFRPQELENGPILIPAHGVFVTKVGSNQTARGFVKELAAKNLKSIRQMIREHREAASWEEAFCEVRLWRCPDGTAVPPFPPVPEPAMQVDVPDPRWVGMWRTATEQLRGPHMWGNLAAEVAPVARAMELIGLHAEAAKIYDYFLASPGVKSDGDFSDPKGSLEWAKAMRHDMGYNHEGTHCSTGRLLLSMMEHYFLTGDREWFLLHRERIQAAADWIIRERKTYMQCIPNREALHVAGLMPPSMMGDYALPACDWHWYYFDNAFSVQGLTRFADVLMEIDPAAGLKYRDEADAFRADIRRAVERDVVLSPVRLGRDGMCHSYIPWDAYSRGLMNTELGVPQYGGGRPMDLMLGSLPLASIFSVLDPSDARMVDTLNVLEEGGTSVNSVREVEDVRKEKGLSPDDAWFWMAYIDLPKWAFNPNIYLLQDDVPCFLRFWMNESVSMVGADGKLWEHYRPDSYAPCKDPDNGTSGWFLDNFRNLLVMEIGDSLWLARATPRVWLEQGKKISVKHAPTYFGVLTYEIVSDVDNGRISATVEIPSRKASATVIVRFRHPKAAPIKSVKVNGKTWKKFDKDKETIKLKGLTGTVAVTAVY